MVKEVVRTEDFLRQLKKLDKSLLDKIEKLIVKIINEPEIGKQMRFDRKGTREVYLVTKIIQDNLAQAQTLCNHN